MAGAAQARAETAAYTSISALDDFFDAEIGAGNAPGVT
jgi:hypothetical protein